MILVLGLILPLTACDQLGSQSPEEHIQNAIEYRDQDKLNAAVIELKNALQQSPDNAKARLLLGKVYVESGQGRAAEKELRRAISLGVDEGEIALELAKAMLIQGRYQDVLDALQPSRQSDPARHAEALIVKGDAGQALGKIELACADYQQASKLDADNLSADLGLVRCDVLQDRIDQARARVKRLLQQHPKHAQSWIMLGRIEAAAQQNKAALDAFDKALELSPNQPGALLGRAQIELIENQLDAAEADIEALRKLAPTSVQANHLLGFLRFRQGRFNDAALAYQDALRANPDFDPAILWLGLTNYAQHNYEQAIQRFSRFLQKYPDSVRVKVLLALSQAQAGGDDAAVQTLRELQGVDIEDPKVLAAIGQAALSAGDSATGRHYFEQAVARAPDKAAFRMALASVLLESGDARQAIEELDVASQLDKKDSRADVALIRTLIAKRQLDQALPAIDRLQEKLPESAIPEVLRGLVFLLQKKSDTALQAFTAAVKKDPDSIGGHHGLAVLAIQKRDFAAAKKHYQAILDAHPGNLRTELALSGLARRSDDRAGALSWLERAAEDNPESAIAAGLYARELLAQGKTRKALQAIQKALETNPEHVGLLYMRGASLLAEGEHRAAADTYQELIAAHPKFMLARLQLARARRQLNDIDGAREALTEALELSPHHVGAKVTLLLLEAQAKNFSRALKLVHEIEQQHPKSPVGQLLEAQVRVLQDKLPQAIDTLLSAAKAHPESRAVMRMLASLQWATGKREASVTILAAWLKTHPGDLQMARALGDRYLAMGRNKAAGEIYEKVIQDHPRDALVLNNLALARWLDDPEQAMKLAREANRLQPKNPALQDTLGWMLVEDGQVEQGLPLLESAKERLGDSLTVQYHYAAALARAGRQSAAREELKDLLAKDKSFPEKNAAQALLEKL
ncbi:TPR repeat protein [Nitrococcus mobilis Nb-231]|uniref:TPR repeat protein n=1 Tax=Nitrococcus mobilis Nb-231 TaxID=314278 RepID=A4BSK8_9GAMM|nr:TPR repeat protein [Nitrococcus mobilis Nb-231]